LFGVGWGEIMNTGGWIIYATLDLVLVLVRASYYSSVFRDWMEEKRVKAERYADGNQGLDSLGREALRI